MTFSQVLQENIYEPWRLEYVAYDDIKYDLQQRQKDHQWNENDENQFETTISLEAEKVDFFITKKQKEIDVRISYCERILNQQKSTSSGSSNLSETTSKTLDDILMDLNDLSKFTRCNVLAIESLIDAHDLDTAFNARSLFVYLIRSKNLDKQRFDEALVKVATLQDNILPVVENKVTAKFWVHPNNLTELRATLLFHLPVLDTENKAISSIYVDTPRLDLYQQRLQLDDESETIRFRWYGSMNSSNNVFVEREIRHLPDIKKDSVCLDVRNVQDFIYGTYTADHYADELRAQGIAENSVHINHTIAAEIQETIMEKNLLPMMRVFYKRTVFQAPNDPRLHLSLDTDLCYIREDNRKEISWRTNIDFPFDNAYQFPYALLKMQPGQATPQWLSKLLDSSLVYEIPRFTKHLHGAASLWGRQLPVLPWWLSQLELNIQNKISGNFADITKCNNLKPVINGQRSIGYLEFQLDQLSSLKHGPKLSLSPSGKTSRQRSYMAGSFLGRTSAVIRPSMESPTWTQEDYSQEDFYARSSLLAHPQMGNSSTDNLIGGDTYTSRRKNKGDKPKQEDEIKLLGEKTDLEVGLHFNIEKKKKKKKDPKVTGATIEPKIFFASERTFIRWLHFACTLMTLALTLMNFGDTTNRIVGVAFLCLAFVFSIYAFFFSRWRAHRITNQPHLRYDDWFGPPMLCFFFIGALILNFILRWRSPAQNTNYLGVGNSTAANDTSL